MNYFSYNLDSKVKIQENVIESHMSKTFNFGILDPIQL